MAWALYLALSCSSYSNAQQSTTGVQDLIPGQVYSTGNIVIPTTTTSGSTWTNGVYQDQLTCWAWGNPGYCGPNPIVRPGDNINFSFGMTDLYQAHAIANVLPSSGSGLTINGYRFSFTAKNGNGWDDGRVDTLSAYVSFYNASGKSVEYDYYNLNSKFNWTTFNYNKDFVTPYASQDLSTVRYGFVGRDNNFWAGPYGPEVNNVSFNLKYSVDPCATNPMYSPSCAGYADALMKLVPAAPPPASPPPLAPPPVAIADAPPPVATAQPQALPPPAQAPVVATATPSANNPQPKAGEVTPSGSKPPVSMSTIMSILSTESTKVGAIEKSVVQQAVSEAQKAGDQTTQQAEAVAGTLTSQSVATSMTQTATSAKVSMFNSTQTAIVSMTNTQSASSQLGIRSVYQVTSIDTSVGQSSMVSMSSASVFQLSTNRNILSVEPELPTTEGIKFGSRSVLGDYMNAKQFMSLMGSEQLQDGNIKRNVQPNEVAGGVDINTIATQPKGYEAYSQVVLSDASFYKVDSIYKNQTTVDNARVLRGLTGGSDRLHQEMIDQQYKGN